MNKFRHFIRYIVQKFKKEAEKRATRPTTRKMKRNPQSSPRDHKRTGFEPTMSDLEEGGPQVSMTVMLSGPAISAKANHHIATSHGNIDGHNQLIPTTFGCTTTPSNCVIKSISSTTRCFYR